MGKLNGVEQNRAREDGRRAAMEYLKNHKKNQDNNTPQQQEKVKDGLASPDKSKFIKDGPSKYDDKNNSGNSDSKNKNNQDFTPTGERKIQSPNGNQRNDQSQNGEHSENPSKNESDGQPSPGGLTPVYRKRLLPKGDNNQAQDGGKMDPQSTESASIENIDHNEDDHMPGTGSVAVDSLCGENIFNYINDAVKRAKESGEDIGIEDITDSVPNKQVSESEKREMMRKLIQSGIDNKTLTNNERISKENPLSIDPSRYCSFPFLDWRKVLENFLQKIDVQWESNWYGSPYKHGDFKYSLAWRDEHASIEEGVGHIVISVDTSSSVSEEKITLFLSQVGEVLDSAINDEIIVDVVKSASNIITVDRFLHRKGEFAKEAKIIRNEGERGGTDYTNSLKFFHYMMMDTDDREKNGYNQFIKEYCPSGIHTIDEDLKDLDAIPPASGYILFTDGDYFLCEKYYGTMEAESAPFEEFVDKTCFFVGLDSYDVRVGNVNIWGNPYEKDPVFGNRTYVCSMKMFWDRYIKRKINESVNMVRRNIKGFSNDIESTKKENTQKVSSEEEQKPEDNEEVVSVDDIVSDIKNRGVQDVCTGDNMSLINALETCNLDYKIEKNGIVHIVGNQTLDKDKLTVFSGIHGNPQYVIDGNITITGGSLSFFDRHKPIRDNNTLFLFKDNPDITYRSNGSGTSYLDFLESLPDSMKYRVKYVNCENITRELIEENDSDGIQSNVKAFSNDANLVIEYINKYVEQLIESNKKYSNAGFIIKYKEQGEDKSYSTYTNGILMDPKSDLYLCPSKRSLINFYIDATGPNSKSSNRAYGYNRYGFPPFISIMCPEIIIDGERKPINSVDYDSLQHIGEMKINN